jgi:hypothetical protein
MKDLEELQASCRKRRKKLLNLKITAEKGEGLRASRLAVDDLLRLRRQCLGRKQKVARFSGITVHMSFGNRLFLIKAILTVKMAF